MYPGVPVEWSLPWTPPSAIGSCNGTGVHLGLDSPHKSQLWVFLPLSSPATLLRTWHHNVTLNPRETALEQLPTHYLDQQQTGQLSFHCSCAGKGRMARQENSSSPAQGEIWQAKTPEYLRGITNWRVYLHDFFTHFLYPKASLHCAWGEKIWHQTQGASQSKSCSLASTWQER